MKFLLYAQYTKLIWKHENLKKMPQSGYCSSDDDISLSHCAVTLNNWWCHFSYAWVLSELLKLLATNVRALFSLVAFNVEFIKITYGTLDASKIVASRNSIIKTPASLTVFGFFTVHAEEQLNEFRWHRSNSTPPSLLLWFYGSANYGWNLYTRE